MAKGKQRRTDRKSLDDERTQEAAKILERVERESETVGTSSMARVSKLEQTSLGTKVGGEADNDPIEILGKRIGRTLGWIAVIFLVVYLISTYLL